MIWVVEKLRHGPSPHPSAEGAAFYLASFTSCHSFLSSTSLPLYTTSEPPPLSPSSTGPLVYSTEPLLPGHQKLQQPASCLQGLLTRSEGLPNPRALKSC